VAQRGAANEAFRLLFTLPFDLDAVDAYSERSSDGAIAADGGKRTPGPASFSMDATGMERSQGGISSQALHEWVIFGVRAIVDVTFTPTPVSDPEPTMKSPPEVTDPDADARKPGERQPRRPLPHWPDLVKGERHP